MESVHFYFIAIIYMFIRTNYASNDYCRKEYCKTSGGHTLCKYPNKYASRCKDHKNTELSKTDVSEILRIHNELRSKVAQGHEHAGSGGSQPGAANMHELRWDSFLQHTARRWAIQCKNGHDECRGLKGMPVGQNVASSWSSDSTRKVGFKELIQPWYDEVQIFDKKYVHSYVFNSKTGHYTQMVWAKTTHVGCGYVRFKDKSMFLTRLVCNYSPSGNFLGQPMYLVGKAASHCPHPQQSSYPGLCGTPHTGRALAPYSTSTRLIASWSILLILMVNFMF